MQAAAHNPKFAKKAGIKQAVAKEFNAADQGALKKASGGRARFPVKRLTPASPNMANHMVSDADRTLADTGDRLRGSIGRIGSGRSGMFRKQGGVVKKASGDRKFDRAYKNFRDPNPEGFADGGKVRSLRKLKSLYTQIFDQVEDASAQDRPRLQKLL